MKLKHIAAVTALMAATAPAFAYLNGPDDDAPAELFLSIWSATPSSGGTGNINSSYSWDTGVTLQDMIANKSTNLFVNQIVSGNSDFASFIASVNTATPGALQFNVTAAERSGNQGAASNILLQTFAGSTIAPKNSDQLSNALDQILVYAGAQNATGTHITQDNGYSVSTSGDEYFMSNLSNTWNSFTGINSVAVGTSATFGSMVQNGFGGNATINTIFPGKFFLGQTTPGVYALQYQVSAVPEPTGFALALAGLALLGFVGIRRKS